MATRKKEVQQETAAVTGQVAEVLVQVGEQLVDNQQVSETVVAKVNKAEVGRKIFEEEQAKGSARKDIIARLINEAGLTKAGAATYLQNMKKKAGLVHTKQQVVA